MYIPSACSSLVRPSRSVVFCFLFRLSCFLLLSAGCYSQGMPQVTPVTDSSAANDAGSDFAVLDQHADAVSSLFAQRKFDELDEMADSERSGKERFPGGGWKLYTFYMSLEYPVASNGSITDTDWEDHIARLQEWVTLHPASVTARIALAGSYLNYAWRARGDDYADKVTEEGWRLFHQRIALADAALQDAAKLPTKCPHWYYHMLWIAIAEDWDNERTRALLEESYSFEPYYYYSYQAYVTYLLPKWDGEDGDSERFIDEISKRIGGEEGDMIYFEVATDLIRNSGSDTNYVERISWPRIMRGYAANEERYGVSTLKMNVMAYTALAFCDTSSALDLFARIGEKWNKSVWRTKENFDKSRAAAIASPVIRMAPKVTAGPKPAELKSIASVANANTDTPEGSKYVFEAHLKFIRVNNSLYMECLRGAGEDLGGGSFDYYVLIGKAGNVMEVRDWPQTKVSECMLPALSAATFAVPPQSPYWVKFEMALPLHPFGVQATTQK